MFPLCQSWYMISFIIPVYNKGEILFKTLSSLIAHLNRSPFADYEIIIVSDGSTDNSFTEALRFKTRSNKQHYIKIFHYNKNIGKGFALRFGFFKSRGQNVVFLDGDLDISSNQVLTALKVFYKNQSDMVIGSKYHPRSRIHYPYNRFLYSLVLKQIIKLMFNLSVSDTQVGLKVFRRDILSNIFSGLIIKRFAMDLEMLVVAQMRGYTNIMEVPVIIKRTSAYRSSINITAVKNFCVDILAIYYRKNILSYYDRSLTFKPLPSLQIQTG